MSYDPFRPRGQPDRDEVREVHPWMASAAEAFGMTVYAFHHGLGRPEEWYPSETADERHRTWYVRREDYELVETAAATHGDLPRYIKSPREARFLVDADESKAYTLKVTFSDVLTEAWVVGAYSTWAKSHLGAVLPPPLLHPAILEVGVTESHLP